jgi:hypothetical protein
LSYPERWRCVSRLGASLVAWTPSSLPRMGPKRATPDVGQPPPAVRGARPAVSARHNARGVAFVPCSLASPEQEGSPLRVRSNSCRTLLFDFSFDVGSPLARVGSAFPTRAEPRPRQASRRQGARPAWRRRPTMVGRPCGWCASGPASSECGGSGQASRVHRTRRQTGPDPHETAYARTFSIPGVGGRSAPRQGSTAVVRSCAHVFGAGTRTVAFGFFPLTR